MKKNEFLDSLYENLNVLSRQDLIRIIDYYDEMIEDKIEAGENEEDAVASIGAVDKIVSQVLGEKTHSTPPENKKSKKPLIFILAGSPLWIPLLLAAASVGVSLYASAWVIVASVAITEAALLITSPFCVIYGVIAIIIGNAAWGLINIGAGLVLTGGAVLLLSVTIKLVRCAVRYNKLGILKIVQLTKGEKKDNEE